jgi:hypothetical protein
MAGKRKAGTRELMTWVGTHAPIPNTLLPSASKCVGLADLSVMPPQGRANALQLLFPFFRSLACRWGLFL